MNIITWQLMPKAGSLFICYEFADTKKSWNSGTVCEDILSKFAGCPTTLKEAFNQIASHDAPLNARLAAYVEHSKRIWPELAAGYNRLVERIATITHGEVGPAVGSAMPPFVMPDQDGQLVSLPELLQTGPVVISFNRGHWCPYCKLQLRELAAVHQEVSRLGAQIVSIVPDLELFSHKLKEDNSLPFKILTDVDLGYALSLGLVFWLGPEVKKLYDETGIELARYQGNGSYFLPMAAIFVVGRDGLITARHVDHDFRRRMDSGDIIAAIARL